MSASAASILASERQRSPAVVDLARHLAIAVRVEPALLRAMRLRHVRTATVAVETDLWFSPLVKVRDPAAMVLRPDVREELLNELRQPTYELARLNAWEVIQRVHRDGPPVMRLEEHATYLTVSGRISEMEAVLGGALEALVADSTYGIARWAARSLSRMPKEIRQSPPALALARAAAERLGPITVRGVLDTGATPTRWSPEMLRALPRVTIFARLVATPASPRGAVTTLEVSSEPFLTAPEDAAVAGAVAALSVPATRPLIVDVLTPEDTGWREERLSVESGVRTSVRVAAGPSLRIRNLIGAEVRMKPSPSNESAVVAIPAAFGDAWNRRLTVVDAAEDLQWQVLETLEDARSVQMSLRGRSASDQIGAWLGAPTADAVRLTRALLISHDEAAFDEWFTHARTPSSAAPPVPAEVFYGRDDVLREIRAFATAHDNRYLLLVLGSAGIGKSAVLREFARNPRLTHARVVYYGAERVLSDDELGAELASLVPGWEELDPGSERLPGHERLRHLLALCAAAGAISATRPLVMVVDGLDGSDKETDGVLELLSVFPSQAIPGVRVVTSARERLFMEPPIDEPVRVLDLGEERWRASGLEAVEEFWTLSPSRYRFSGDRARELNRISDGCMRVAAMLNSVLTADGEPVSTQRLEVLTVERLQHASEGLPGVVQLVQEDVERLGSVSKQEAVRMLQILSVARRPIPLRELAPGYIDQPATAIQDALSPLLAPVTAANTAAGRPEFVELIDRTSLAPALAQVAPDAGGAGAHSEVLETLRRFVTHPDDRQKPFADWAKAYLDAFSLRHLAGAGRFEELVSYGARAANIAALFRELGFEAGSRELAALDRLRPTAGWPEPFASYLRIVDGQAHWIRRDPESVPGVLWTQLQIEGHDLEDPVVARSYGLDDIRLPIRLMSALGPRPTETTNTQVFEGHTGPVFACAISEALMSESDRRARDQDVRPGELWYPLLVLHRAVSASKDGSARIWDLEAGRELYPPLRHTAAFTAIAISRDGGIVVAGALDGSVFRWHPDRPERGARWTPHGGPVSACVFGEGLFLTGGEDGTVNAFELAGQGPRPLLTWSHAVVACFVIGTEVAAVHADGRVQLADVRSGEQVRSFDFRGPVTFCSLRRHQPAIVAVHSDGTESVLDLRSGQVTAAAQLYALPSVTAFEESGDLRFTALARSAELTLKSLTDPSGSSQDRRLSGHHETVRSVAFGAVRERPVLLSASEDHTLKLWDCTSGREMVTLGVVASQLLAAGSVIGFAGIPVAASGSAATATRVIAYPTGPTTLAVYNVDASAPLFVHTFGAPMLACAFAPADRLTVLLEDGRLHWVSGPDPEPGPPNAPLTSGHRATAFAVNDRVIVAGGADGRLSFSRSPVLEPDRVDAHDGIVRGIALDATGRLAASVGDDGAVLLWSVSDGRLVRRMAESEAPDVACVFSPDDRSVVTGSVSGAVEAFDVEHNAARMLQGHSAGVNALAFKTHDAGVRLITASDDGMLGVLEFDSGRYLGAMGGHTRPVTGCASVPLPGRVVSWSLDRTLRLWDIDSLECVGTIYGHAPFVAATVVSAPAPRRNVAQSPSAPVVLAALDASGMVWLLTMSDGTIAADAARPQA